MTKGVIVIDLLLFHDYFYFSDTSTRRAWILSASLPVVFGSLPSPEVESLAALIPWPTR